MKLQKIAPVLLGLLVSAVSLQAQKKLKEKTVFTPPVVVKDTAGNAEVKKQNYKSKQWRQGDVLVDQNQHEGTSESNIKKHQGKVPPPPPPLPKAPPPPPVPPRKIKNT